MPMRWDQRVTKKEPTFFLFVFGAICLVIMISFALISWIFGPEEPANLQHRADPIKDPTPNLPKEELQQSNMISNNTVPLETTIANLLQSNIFMWVFFLFPMTIVLIRVITGKRLI